MTEALATILILLPFCAAAGCYLLRSDRLSSGLVLATGALLIAGALLLIPRTPFGITAGTIVGLAVSHIVAAADFLLLFVVLY